MNWNNITNGDNTGEKLRSTLVKWEMLPAKAQQRIQIMEAGGRILNACAQIQQKVIAPRNEKRIREATNYIDPTNTTSDPSVNSTTSQSAKVERTGAETDKSDQIIASGDSQSRNVTTNFKTADDTSDNGNQVMMQSAYDTLARLERERQDVK